jgi:Sjoegren syndrome nuclear autoantigen 1
MGPGIEELREKRDEIQLQIAEEESEKNKIQQDLQLLTKRLAHVNDSLARKVSDTASLLS